jgi:hypothetical protein
MDRFRVGTARAVLGLALIGFGGACGAASTQYTELNPPPHPLAPKDPAAVEVLTVSPGRPFVEVGTIDTNFYGGAWDPTAAARKAAVEEGAKRGCDAVIMKREVACIVYTDHPGRSGNE